MSTDAFIREYENMTADEIILLLEKQYKDDTDALEVIERAKKNIAYIKKQKEHKGQTPEQCALECAGNLKYWY